MSRGALAKPYRVAVLAPQVALTGDVAIHAREAAALVWVCCVELLQRHRGLAVLDPEVTPLVPQDGHYAPLGAARGALPTGAVFGPTRRDELVWLELALAGARPVVRLHGVARDGTAQTFEHAGGELGAAIQQVIGAWLDARGLSSGPLARRLDAVTAEDLVAVTRVVAPVLAAEARGGFGAVGADAAANAANDAERERERERKVIAEVAAQVAAEAAIEAARARAAAASAALQRARALAVAQDADAAAGGDATSVGTVGDEDAGATRLQPMEDAGATRLQPMDLSALFAAADGRRARAASQGDLLDLDGPAPLDASPPDGAAPADGSARLGSAPPRSGRAPTDGGTASGSLSLLDEPAPLTVARKANSLTTARLIATRVRGPLRVPALRLLELALGDDLSDLVLADDADHPQALFRRYLAEPEPDEALLRRALTSAPGWAAPLAELVAIDGADARGAPPSLEAVAAASLAAVCAPSSADVLAGTAERLADDGRVDDGTRLLARAAGAGADAHVTLVDLLARADREGPRLRQAIASSRLHGCPRDPALPWYPDQIRMDLRLSSALVGVGRLAEGVALRASRLEGREKTWPSFAQTLATWRTDPRYAAWSFAREGAFRGDDARTLEGFGRAAPDDDVDLALFLDALVALGYEDEALLAWAQHGVAAGHDAPVARLAAARAMLSAGEWRRGLEQLWRVELGAPGRDDQAAIARCGSLLAAAPIDAIEPALAERMAEGATMLARRLARDVADFVPGAARSDVVTRALGRAAGIEVDPAWFAGFAPARGRAAETRRDAIDAMFADAMPARPAPSAAASRRRGGSAGDAAPPADDVARADRLVARWLDAVFADAAEDDAAGLASSAAYAAAQALARYLAMTTQPPSVLAGALRAVAAEALALVRVHVDALSDRDARALLGAIDAPLRRADRWVGGAWLAAVERALHLDERAAGDVAAFAQPHATIASRVLGPEETAVLAWSVARLARERPDGWAAACSAQASRLALHTGRAGADEWAAAVVAQLAAGALETGDALDELYVACYLAQGKTAGPGVAAAKVLLAAGRAGEAIRVLEAALPGASPVQRDALLVELAPLWPANDVPFGASEAAAAVFAALSARDPARAETIGRWLVARDPGNADAQRNLGLALAQQGKLDDALAHLTRGSRDVAAQLLAGVLSQRDRLREAIAVLDYASRWYARPEPWLAYARVADEAIDIARTVRGYARAWAIDPAAFQLAQLDAYAGVLDEVGDHAACAEVALRLRDAAGSDVAWRAAAANHLACARIGQRRFAEASAAAEEAVRINPSPNHERAFAATLARARAGQVRPPLEVAAMDARGRVREPAFEAIEASDFAIAALADDAAASWRVRRAALAAARFRGPADDHVAVTSRARTAAAAVIADSIGATDPDARIARAAALAVREAAYFPREPAPPLGARMSREAFRGEAAAPTPPAELELDAVDGPVARASDYAALLRDLAARPPAEALAVHGLDEAGYAAVCAAWAAAFAADPSLAAAVEAALAPRT